MSSSIDKKRKIDVIRVMKAIFIETTTEGFEQGNGKFEIGKGDFTPEERKGFSVLNNSLNELEKRYTVGKLYKINSNIPFSKVRKMKLERGANKGVKHIGETSKGKEIADE